MASQSSPLTMAMLGGGVGGGMNSPYGMAMYDPQTMAAMQRLGFAQNLASQGLDSSPAYPAQALSRLGQALLGGVMLKQGYGDLEQLGQQRQQEGAASDSFVYGPRPTQSAPTAPQSSAAPTGGTLQSTVAASESGGRPDVVNSQGFSGKYQFGKPALISAGVYQPAQGENTSVNGDWRGTFNVAPYKPMSYDEFLKNGNAQDAAWNAHAANLDREIQTRGLDKYVGQTIGGVPITHSALIGMMQIGGPTGTQRFIESGGVYNPADANGTHISDFGKRTSGTQYAQAGNVATDASTAPAPQQPGTQQPQGAPQQVVQAGPQPQPQGAPQQPGSPQVGLDNRDVQHALEIQHLAASIRAQHPNPMDPMNIRAQAYDKYADHLLSIGQYQTNPNGTQLNRVSGKVENAAEPLAHYVRTPTGSEDTTGTHPPTFMPSPRIAQTPAGPVVAVGPGGQVTQIAPADNPGVAARAAATAQGGETGKIVAATPSKMADIGREADAAIGNIDYGINQLHEAAKGNINSGYFAPWLATAAAAGKSLGIDLKSFGIDPAAVGNVQSAQKTLGVVAGTILQNTIGKDSQITDAKIEHFIHTQPGIETDPQAIERIMNWARSQFTYSREMAMDAMQHTDPATGMLPLGWNAAYIAKKGAFAPIYDPLSQEMKQPQGQGPAAEMPKAPAPQQQTQAPAQPSRADIEAELRRRGLLK